MRRTDLCWKFIKEFHYVNFVINSFKTEVFNEEEEEKPTEQSIEAGHQEMNIKFLSASAAAFTK